MCGFAGVVSWEKRCRVTEQMLDAMSRRIAHRGPDGQGLWINEPDIDPDHDRPQAGLVHRRLAILDIDPRANQPFTDGAGRWIAFNGEIYNFRELRQELTQLRPDYRWKTECDTEVLLIAYDAWGASCVEHLNGMFAFAVWDQPDATLFSPATAWARSRSITATPATGSSRSPAKSPPSSRPIGSHATFGPTASSNIFAADARAMERRSMSRSCN